MLGPTQLGWLHDRAGGRPRRRWTVLANQTVMTPMPIGSAFNLDQWDGYPAERSQIAGVARARSGTRWCSPATSTAAGVGLLRDEAAGSPTVGTEIITTSISSRSHSVPPGGGQPRSSAASRSSPYFEARYRGYTRCDVTPDGWDIDYVAVDALTPTPAGPGGRPAPSTGPGRCHAEGCSGRRTLLTGRSG